MKNARGKSDVRSEGQAIGDKVRAYVRKKALKDGDRLPPERELAAILGIGRRAVRQSLSQMELEGQVWRGRRNGTILGRAPATTAAGIDRTFSVASPSDVIESRLAVEPAISALAATKATEADLKAIENCIGRTVEVTNDESWTRWDSAFHLAIAEATHNEIFIAMIRAFNAVRGKTAWRAMRIASTSTERKKNAIAHHRAILAALRKRNPEEAGQAMRDHLSIVKRNLFG